MNIDTNRQPRYGADLQSLEAHLRGQGLDNPYEGAGAILSKCPAYGTTCSGLPADTRSLDFAYRLTALSDVLLNSTARPPYDRNPAYRNWTDVFEDFNDAQTWLPVTNYASGNLRGRRRFTWWTVFDLSIGTVILNGHQIGLPNNWIARQAVILRLDLRQPRMHGTVPTVIDGFDSIIFHSTQESIIPTMGKAIDLRKPGTLSLGASEFVVNDIPTELLSLVPVEIDETIREQFRVDLRDEYFLEKLAEFYSGQEAMAA